MPYDPFAGADKARDDLSAVTARIRSDPGLSDEEREAAVVIVQRACSALASDVKKAEKGMEIADKVVGWIKSPASLLSLIGL